MQAPPQRYDVRKPILEVLRFSKKLILKNLGTIWLLPFVAVKRFARARAALPFLPPRSSDGLTAPPISALSACISATATGPPPRIHNRPSHKVEKFILSTRQQLHEHSDLGAFGAAAILAELKGRGRRNPPALRTIGYILQPHGALAYRRRVRRRPPAVGWQLADVAAAVAEVAEFAVVEALVIRGQGAVEVLDAVSLPGGLVESWPQSSWNAESAPGSLRWTQKSRQRNRPLPVGFTPFQLAVTSWYGTACCAIHLARPLIL